MAAKSGRLYLGSPFPSAEAVLLNLLVLLDQRLRRP
jgi:hypothetical protein